MNANKFIALNNDQLVFTSGKYIVGKDIPAGEYYFWGKDIWYSYTIKSEKFHKEFVHDAYATFEAGTTFTVSRGKFTPVFNIIYNREPSELLYPDHVYRVGGEISTGYYIFKFDKKYFSESLSPFCVDNDATLSTSKTYPLSSYTRFSGYVGIAEVKANDNFAFVNNGIAEFYGEQPINLYSLISSTSLQNNRLYRRGETVFSSRLCNIIVYKRDSNRIYFHGASDAYIYEQYIYSINGTNFWAGFVNVLTFKPFHWLEMILENSDTGKQYRFGKGQIDIKSITNLSHSSKDRAFREYRFSRKCLYEIRLPEGAELGKISVVGLRPEHSAEDLYLVSADIRTIYSREFNKMAFVLNQFQNLGLQIDIENELYHFEQCPDLLLICLDFLEKCLASKTLFDAKPRNCNLRLTFRVDATYDKTFYCVAKLADNAVNVQVNEDETIYEVTFSGNQIEEITLMYGALVNPFNFDNEDLVAAKEFSIEYDYFSFLASKINDLIFKLNKDYGYSSLITGSVLASINKLITKQINSKLSELYTEMAKEGRITTRWGNEYKLFMLISRIVKDAKYQYRTRPCLKNKDCTKG